MIKMEKYNKSQKTVHHIHPHHMNKMLLIVILLAVVLILMVKPTVESFYTSQKFKSLGSDPEIILQNLESLENELSLIKTSEVACKNLSAELISENEDLQKQFLNLKNEINSLNSELAYKDSECESIIKGINQTANSEIKSMELEVSNAIKELSDIESDLEELAKNSARSICCKQRVDTPEIDSYDVLNNKIVCSSEGDLELTC